MPYTAAIAAIVPGYTWVAAPLAAATAIILMSFDPAVTNSLRTGWRHFQ